MAVAQITEDDIRMFLMDKPELNPLLGGLRWSPDMVERAMVNAVAYFNESVPATGNSYTIENFPYRYCLIIGTSGLLLRSASINQASNQLSYSADGVSVQDNDKAGVFAQLGGSLWDEFKQLAYNIKMNQYTSALYGTIGSEFRR